MSDVTEPIPPYRLDREGVRSLDREAIEKLGIPGITLMENAFSIRVIPGMPSFSMASRSRDRTPSRSRRYGGIGSVTSLMVPCAQVRNLLGF